MDKPQTTHIDILHYADIVKTAPNGFDPFKDGTFLIARHAMLAQYWCPSEYVPGKARIGIVDITPGREQATIIFGLLERPYLLANRPLMPFGS